MNPNQAGCSSPPAKRDGELLARHPVRETRMSARAEAGYAPSGVWKVQGLHNTVYLAGTSHLLTSNQVPFPSPFYAAYADAQEVFLEADGVSFFGQLRLMFKLRKWLPKLTSALRSRHNVMVLVGAAHLAGKDGLLNLLREAGFTVEQLFGVEPTVTEARE